MVNLLWISEGSELSKVLVEDLPFTDSYIAEALNEIKKSTAIERARKLAIDYADEARSSLLEALNSKKGTVNSDAVECLLSIMDYTIERVK